MADERNSGKAAPRRRRWWLFSCCALVGLLLLLRGRFQVMIVAGESMQPTIVSGDLLILDKWAYRHAAPRREDLVVARCRQEFIVKRVVALPGEQAEVKTGTLYINGISLQETHIIAGSTLDISEGRLLPGSFALLGDNRSYPVAVNVHAIVSRDKIIGKVLFVLRLGRHRHA